MKRRTFLASAAIGSGLATAKAWAALPAAPSINSSFAIDENRVRFYTPAISKPIKVLVVADTHLFKDDQRGQSYQQYSARMASAYNQTKHFRTSEATNPEESFVQVIQQAQQDDVDRLALVGDIFSFPSEAAIDWALEQLAAIDIPYYYVAGNHDWHYEGMEGSLQELRATWIDKRLKPLYQNNNPLMSAYDVGEVCFVAIDNSDYQILPEQLKFYRAQVKTGKPLVLTVHIPLHAPGRSMGFGCGHPDWGASTDQSYKIERRPQWPAAGHTQATLDFHREVFTAPNLLGVVAGHIHQNSVDVINGIPQLVSDDNASGSYLNVEVLPAATS